MDRSEGFDVQTRAQRSHTNGANGHNGHGAVFHAPTKVRKRDGETLQEFDAGKIKSAIRKAWIEVEGHVDEEHLDRVAASVVSTLPADVADVEQIQDHVELVLMRSSKASVAKAYIIYRQKRAEARLARRKPDSDAMKGFIHFSKYARFRPEWSRRELFPETVDRVEEMHLRKFSWLPAEDLAEIRWAFDRVREQRVLPSMRSMQFGGKAIEVNNNRIYNCSFTLIDRPRAFAEAMFLLLSGCGVGYSVQFDHVDKLPALGRVDEKKVRHYVIDDSIEGWADALHALFTSYVEGWFIEFSYHKIRAAGTPLKTSGGRAPGHRKLKEALDAVREILDGAQGRKLRPVECHRVLCHAAEAVLSGGIRRSAMIALFSLEDSEMMYLKTGAWYKKEPWLQNANNSVALKRDEIRKKSFKRIFEMTKEWGEPGFFFCADYDHGTNPCGEIGLNPRLTVNEEVLEMLAQRAERGKPMPEARYGDVLTGWAFCNLCEINAAMFESLDDFVRAAKAAAIIGTLQASYTEMPYLGWVSEVIAEREALLGIGMTGMMDAPTISLDPEMQRTVAGYIKLWNEQWAQKLGIRAAARTTCVKPSGTTSLELGCVASGHHAHHAQRFFRRVTADELEVVFQAFKKVNPHMCVPKPDGKWVVEFPVEAPEGAVLKEHLGALEFLEMVRSTQRNWVLAGTARPESTPGLNHNVSNTVHVKPDEWEAVADHLWENREFFTGVTLIADTSDKAYAFAPHEAVSTEADEQRWNQLIANYRPVEYETILESEDGTAFTAEAACAGGACSVV